MLGSKKPRDCLHNNTFSCFFYLQFEPSGWITYSLLELRKTRSTEHMEKETEKESGGTTLTSHIQRAAMKQLTGSKKLIRWEETDVYHFFLSPSQSPTDIHCYIKKENKTCCFQSVFDGVRLKDVSSFVKECDCLSCSALCLLESGLAVKKEDEKEKQKEN